MTNLEQSKKKRPDLSALFIKSAFAAALILLGLNCRVCSRERARSLSGIKRIVYQTIRREYRVPSLVPFSIAELLLYFLVIGILSY
jgi:hypothetical protein